jgi:hypothetical protein
MALGPENDFVKISAPMVRYSKSQSYKTFFFVTDALPSKLVRLTMAGFSHQANKTI